MAPPFLALICTIVTPNRTVKSLVHEERRFVSPFGPPGDGGDAGHRAGRGTVDRHLRDALRACRWWEGRPDRRTRNQRGMCREIRIAFGWPFVPSSPVGSVRQAAQNA